MEEKLMNEELLSEETAEIPEKQSLKKEIGYMGWGLILYTVINVIIVFADMVRQIAFMMFENERTELSEEQLLAVSENALGMIAAVTIGVLFLWLFMRKRIDRKEMFATKNQMNGKTLLAVIGVFMLVQMVFSGLTGLMEAGLNLFGYSAMGSIEAATGASSTVSMFIYVSFAGPIAEELVYRGFVMQPLRKHGTIFAMVVSAFLFGIMHGNVVQIPFAFLIGLILAYISLEYSVKWSIVVHVINNFVFVELMGLVGKVFGETAELIVSNLLVWGFAVLGIVVLWKNRKKIKDFIQQNKTSKGLYRVVFTTISILLFTIGNLLAAVSAIEPMVI